MTFIKKYHLFLFFLVWAMINFIQAGNTVLLNDEAYYWVYSNFLDWGYFDHPPMIAVLIKAGYFLFPNEFGVRLFIVILNTLTLWLIYNLLPRKNDALFYAIACSIALIQFGGFIAVPDIPLVFFVALFFVAYKNFLVSFSWLQTVFLGIVMALMLYSKYHGVLVILFTLISNPALLKNKRAYIAVVIAVVLFTPHLYWQYQHNFPSLQYHLFERNEASYHVSYSLEYIAGQLLLAGPFMGWLFLIGAFKYQPQNLFEKSLKFCLTGIYLFFLITTLKGRAEPNWTVPAIIPLIVLSHQYLCAYKKWQRILFFTVPLSLIAIFFIRFYLVADNKFISILNTNEFEQNRMWASKINNLSGRLPVVFINSYQKASKYWFYSGIPSFSLNTPQYRRNNYNYWPVEGSMQGKAVYVLSTGGDALFKDSLQTSAGILRGNRIDSFYSHSGIQLKLNGTLGFTKKSYITASISLKNEGTWFDTSAMKLQMHIFKSDAIIASYKLRITAIDLVKNNLTFITWVPVVLPSGSYFARLSMSSAIPGYPSLNSTNLKLAVR